MDKNNYQLGEPVFVVWEYKKIGSADVPFARLDPHYQQSGIRATSGFAEATVFLRAVAQIGEVKL